MTLNKNYQKKFIELINILKILRGPNGCPWDKKQTSKNLIPYLLEETYEVIEAIENDDNISLKEELGDLLLHILFQAEIANEQKKFNIYDCLNSISNKLIKRHPNIFNDEHNEKSWEELKKKEKNRDSVLNGVPKTLPALSRAQRIQEKASSVGFDWKNINPVIDKIDEEIVELKDAIDENDIEKINDEMGDVLFSLINLCRFLKINSESALRSTISKFEFRFKNIEKLADQKGLRLSDLSLEEMDDMWNKVKKNNI
tara:strand:- start:839 stop:1609 length:771 start_codon:yes stop_codon:yes gene_type:complete